MSRRKYCTNGQIYKHILFGDTKLKEGSLDAPVRHNVAWQDEDFYNTEHLDEELRRVFDVCHGCRRCFNLCDSFPKLFDLIDDSE